MKQGDGGPILVAGSSTLVHSLVDHDLVDEYRMMVFPVVIGGGHRELPDPRQRHALQLVDTRSFPTGVVVHAYHRAFPCSGAPGGYLPARRDSEGLLTSHSSGRYAPGSW